MEKVVFDTNIIRNTDVNNFLGGRSELEKFSEVAEVVIPDLVIEEIKNQKRTSLKSKKTSFMDNPFHWLIGLNQDDTKNFDIEAYLDKLINDESFKYHVISVTDYSIFKKITELAIHNQPPFEEKSDKGFKDAYIYFAILEYLQTIADKKIFVCCKDGKLTEALNKHSEIIVIKNYEEFLEQTIGKYQTTYYIEKLKSEIDQNIEKENITKLWININDNEVISIELNDQIYVVEFDSGEIVSNENINTYTADINNLVNSGSFATTHKYINSLTSYLQFLTDEEIINIMQGVKDNEQVHWILSDDDVKQFVTTLYDGKKDILSNELKESIKELLE